MSAFTVTVMRLKFFITSTDTFINVLLPFISMPAAFEVGAAPITLINGDSLIELLIENEIGITLESISYFLINKDIFENDTSESENEN